MSLKPVWLAKVLQHCIISTVDRRQAVEGYCCSSSHPLNKACGSARSAVYSGDLVE